jgi:hypothetical protein
VGELELEKVKRTESFKIKKLFRGVLEEKARFFSIIPKASNTQRTRFGFDGQEQTAIVNTRRR